MGFGLATKELSLLTCLRTWGILEDISERSLPRAGVVMVSCADGHQMPDIVSHMYGGRLPLLTRIWRRHVIGRAAPCIHTLAMNGGGLLLSPTSSLNCGEGDLLLTHIEGAMRLKNLRVVAPLVHYPCGAAMLAQMTPQQVIWHLRAAVDELIRRIPSAEIIPLMHIDWGNGRKRTYRVRTDYPVFSSVSTPPPPVLMGTHLLAERGEDEPV